jgi:hypothetical protein
MLPARRRRRHVRHASQPDRSHEGWPGASKGRHLKRFG